MVIIRPYILQLWYNVRKANKLGIYSYKGYIKPGETSKWGMLNTHTNYSTKYRFLKSLS